VFIPTAFQEPKTVKVTDYLHADTNLNALTRSCISVPISTVLERYIG